GTARGAPALPGAAAGQRVDAVGVVEVVGDDRPAEGVARLGRARHPADALVDELLVGRADRVVDLAAGPGAGGGARLLAGAADDQRVAALELAGVEGEAEAVAGLGVVLGERPGA